MANRQSQRELYLPAKDEFVVAGVFEDAEGIGIDRRAIGEPASIHSQLYILAGIGSSSRRR